MSSRFENIFERLSYVVDRHFDGVGSRLTNEAGIHRQNYTNWKNAYDDGKEPNIELKILKPVVKAIKENTDISIFWLLTGEGEPDEILSKEKVLSGQVADHKKKVDQTNNSELPQDEIAEYLLKNRKAVLEFLRSLE